MSQPLKPLTREQKLAALDALEEKKKRLAAAKGLFKPHPAQMKVWLSKAKEKFLFCGNGFGKTAFLVNWIHAAATGIDTVTGASLRIPSTIYLVVDDPTKIEQVFLPEYSKWHHLDPDQLHKDGKAYVSRITYSNGSVLHVLTHEVNLLKVEGVQLTHLAIDEPCPSHIYIGLKRGGRIPGRPLQVLMAGTPLYQPWLRTDIYERWVEGELPDVECFTGEMDDNPFLEKDYKESFSNALTEEERLTRFKGAFSDLSGQALASLFSEKHHLLPVSVRKQWPKDQPCVVIMDPHPSKAHVAVLLGADKDNYLYVLDEYAEKALARGFTQALVDRGWFTSFRVIDIVYDSLGNQDTTSGEGFRSFGEVVNEVLKENEIGRARATTYNEKDDEDFVERIRDSLHVPKEVNSYGVRTPKLRLINDCKGAINDIKQVQWQRDKKLGENKPKLDIRNTDRLACIKYGLATNLTMKKSNKSSYTVNRPIYGFKTRSQKMLQLARGRRMA